MDEKVLKKLRHWIVDNYGQSMVNLLNSTVPTVFEYPEELKEFLLTHFEPSRELANAIFEEGEVRDFKTLIYMEMDIPSLLLKNSTGELKTPEELFDEAGYILYPECQTEADIQSFRHYYYRGEGHGPTPIYVEGFPPERYQGEELCTFNGDRLSFCRVWFAVKKNVAEIRREDFTNPQREDEYGTSVISIQFERHDGTLSIKNRYNHTVMNPDCTFHNDLDAIIPGLTEAFSRVYGVEEKIINEFSTFDKSQPLKNIDLYSFVKAQSRDGKAGEKLYKLNLILNDIWYCDNNIIIKDGKVIEDKTTMPPEKKRVIDYFVFDFENKTVTTYDPTIKDGFVDTLQPIKNIQTPRGKIVITKDVKDENGEYEQVVIDVNDSNQITGVSHKNLVECGDDYLNYCESIKNLDMPNLKRCGNSFCANCKRIEELTLESLEECGDYFMSLTVSLRKIVLNKLKICGDGFLSSALNLKEIVLNELERCGDDFLLCAYGLKKIVLNKLKICGDGFLKNAELLEEINLESLEESGDDFLSCAYDLKKIVLNKLKICGDGFLKYAEELEEINLESLEESGDDFLGECSALKEINLPNWRKTGNYAFSNNYDMRKLYAPKLEECGDGFCSNCFDLEEVNLLSLERSGDDFFSNNDKIIQFDAPRWRYTGDGAFASNEKMKKLNAPNLMRCGIGFLLVNTEIEELDLPRLFMCEDGFMMKNSKLKRVNLPELHSFHSKCFLFHNELRNLIESGMADGGIINFITQNEFKI